MLPFASLGELRGYRRVFVAGLAVFTLGSLACALSGSLTTLVASRILQGFGGTGIMSVNAALLCFIYPADQLGRGVGINALVGSISAAIGPSVAAGILSIASWQWLFAINVPVGVVALVFARRELPRTPLALHRFDWLSAPIERGDLWRSDHRHRQSSPVDHCRIRPAFSAGLVWPDYCRVGVPLTLVIGTLSLAIRPAP